MLTTLWNPLLGEATFLKPDSASKQAEGVDWAFNFILAINIFFFVLTLALMAYFIVKYRRREGHKEEATHDHNMLLEITWSVIPSLILVVVFYYGFTGYMEMRTPPEKGYEIDVVASRWSWSFNYPEGGSSGELHVPVGEDVKLTMRSTDVLHSFFVPAFRTKMDIVPGRYTYTWFTPTKPGTYKLYCAEYCGKEHSQMFADVVVHPDHESFNKYIKKISTRTPLEDGQNTYKMKCFTCHSLDGSVKTGPSFKGAWGSTVTLSDGSTVKFDENYVRESILKPQAKIKKGFEGVKMTSFQGGISDKEIQNLIVFLRSLNASEK